MYRTVDRFRNKKKNSVQRGTFTLGNLVSLSDYIFGLAILVLMSLIADESL